MPPESAEEFVKRMQTDKEFCEKIQKEDSEIRHKIIRGAGFDFTREEPDKAMEELSDEELKAVTGGSDSGVADCYVHCHF
ncbi:Nif11-like leader peptide family natural product precursor [Methanoplanus endosymbiosus]|uniref:Nif11-like leader peptide family natural product n=1 Tax=Methanoplanus endosymbiosus TaxID=33865 RepID=A0A9E7PMU5_9EURY|nr:Nif11-like leader peptide family natural product precursor [Methanoplanus endosymbiosus]UUX93155.1 Nif11-like leader peptide family natural product precursor [Methanoplanus endosymbiosus]